MGKKSLVSAKGGRDLCRLRGNVNIATLEGSTQPLTDALFASTTSTVPSGIRFFNVGIDSATNLVNGVFVSVRLRYKTQFYARTNVPG